MVDLHMQAGFFVCQHLHPLSKALEVRCIRRARRLAQTRPSDPGSPITWSECIRGARGPPPGAR